MVNDVGKMALLTVGLIIGGVVLIIGVLRGDSSAVTTGTGIVMAVIGYAVGNGVNAARGEAPSPVFVPTPDRIEKRAAQDAEEPSTATATATTTGSASATVGTLQGEEPPDHAEDHQP